MHRNIITNSRKDWEDSIKNNSSCYFSLVDTIFLYPKDIAIEKFEELLKYEYSIEISLYQYLDDIAIKTKMREIQSIIHTYIDIDEIQISEECKTRINELRSELFAILNKKVEEEWNKQKKEAEGFKFSFKKRCTNTSSHFSSY